MSELPIYAKIIAQSINSVTGDFLTTFELYYPRIIHCYDEETKVLAKVKGVIGFYLFKELRGKSYSILQVNEDGSSEFVEPIAYIEKEVDEELVHSNHCHISYSVTKGHRMLVGSRKANGYSKEVIQASELLSSHTAKRIYHTSDSFKGGNYGKNTEEELELLGFFIGDGHLPEKGFQAKFRLKKQRKIRYLRNLLTEIDLGFDEITGNDLTTTFTFDRLPWMESCYIDKTKAFPSFVNELSSLEWNSVLKGLILSDGSGWDTKKVQFNTTSKYVRDSFHSLNTLHGIPNSYCKFGNTFKFTLKTYNYTQVRWDKNPSNTRSYKGKVYCVTVPSGLIVVSRENKTMVCGNCELLTHRVFSRNTSSSRAVPVNNMIERVEERPFIPEYWGKNQKGMQAEGEISEDARFDAGSTWLSALNDAVAASKKLAALGVHKQLANRVTEPFQYTQVIVTATCFNNWFKLRNHSAAQPEIRDLAAKMQEEYNKYPNTFTLTPGGWHLPYVFPYTNLEDCEYSLDEKLLMCVARCARVSYFLRDGGKTNPEKDILLAKRLLDESHMSPTEHAACAMPEQGMVGNFRGFVQLRKFMVNESNGDISDEVPILTPSQARNMMKDYFNVDGVMEKIND